MGVPQRLQNAAASGFFAPQREQKISLIAGPLAFLDEFGIRSDPATQARSSRCAPESLCARSANCSARVVFAGGRVGAIISRRARQKQSASAFLSTLFLCHCSSVFVPRIAARTISDPPLRLSVPAFPPLCSLVPCLSLIAQLRPKSAQPFESFFKKARFLTLAAGRCWVGWKTRLWLKWSARTPAALSSPA